MAARLPPGARNELQRAGPPQFAAEPGHIQPCPAPNPSHRRLSKGPRLQQLAHRTRAVAASVQQLTSRRVPSLRQQLELCRLELRGAVCRPVPWQRQRRGTQRQRTDLYLCHQLQQKYIQIHACIYFLSSLHQRQLSLHAKLDIVVCLLLLLLFLFLFLLALLHNKVPKRLLRGLLLLLGTRAEDGVSL